MNLNNAFQSMCATHESVYLVVFILLCCCCDLDLDRWPWYTNLTQMYPRHQKWSFCVKLVSVIPEAEVLVTCSFQSLLLVSCLLQNFHDAVKRWVYCFLSSAANKTMQWRSASPHGQWLPLENSVNDAVEKRAV